MVKIYLYSCEAYSLCSLICFHDNKDFNKDLINKAINYYLILNFHESKSYYGKGFKNHDILSSKFLQKKNKKINRASFIIFSTRALFSELYYIYDMIKRDEWSGCVKWTSALDI